jgi:hypothetical protein
MKLGALASDVGKGMFAGLAGTLVMTVAQTVDNSLQKRPPSATPAEAAAKILGVQPTGDEEKKRFSNLVHFGYGTGWGAAEIADDAFQHLVYAVAVNAAYERMSDSNK